jgi:Holliday junction resolvase
MNLGDYGEKKVRNILQRKGFEVEIKGKRTHDYDLIAKKDNKKIAIQVKTIQKGSFQLVATKFLKIDIINGKQVLKGKNDIGINIPWVFMKKTKIGEEFFILRKSDAQNIVFMDYKSTLKKHKGIRPKNPYSFHCTIDANELTKWKNNWKLINKMLARITSLPND